MGRALPLSLHADRSADSGTHFGLVYEAGGGCPRTAADPYALRCNGGAQGAALTFLALPIPPALEATNHSDRHQSARKLQRQVVQTMVPPHLYVDAISGSDSNDGKTASRAFKTLDKGIKTMQSSATVWLLNGTYNMTGNYDDAGTCYMPPGTAEAYSTVAALPGHQPVLAGQINFDCRFPPPTQRVPQYIEFRGLTIRPRADPLWYQKENWGCVHVDWLNFFRLVDIECAWAPNVGIMIGANNTELVRVHVHHAGYNCTHMDAFNATSCKRRHLCHGVYLGEGSNMSVRDSHLHHNSQAGIQVFSGDAGEVPSRNATIRNNHVHDNGYFIAATETQCTGVGIGLYSGQGHSAIHNRIENNAFGLVIDYAADDAFLAHNTVVNSSVVHIGIADELFSAARGHFVGACNATVVNNTVRSYRAGAFGITIDRTSATVHGNSVCGVVDAVALGASPDCPYANRSACLNASVLSGNHVAKVCAAGY